MVCLPLAGNWHLLEDFSPDFVEGNPGAAIDSGWDKVSFSGFYYGVVDDVRQRRLADAAFSVDNNVLTWREYSSKNPIDLVAAPGEKVEPVDWRVGSKGSVNQSYTAKLLFTRHPWRIICH